MKPTRKRLRGDDERNKLVEANMGLAYWYVHKIEQYYRFIPKDDLLQAGLMGLMRAAETWDEAKGFRFTTYALNWVKSFVKRVAYRDRTVQIPEHILRLNEPGTSRMGRAYSMDDMKFDYRDDGSGGGLVPREEEVQYSWLSACEAAEAREEAKVVVKDLKAVLLPQEREVIEGRFTDGLSLRELGRRMGVSVERVRQIEVKALDRMKRYATRRERQKEYERDAAAANDRQAGGQAKATSGTTATPGTTAPEGANGGQGEGDLPQPRKRAGRRGVRMPGRLEDGRPGGAD